MMKYPIKRGEQISVGDLVFIENATLEASAVRSVTEGIPPGFTVAVAGFVDARGDWLYTQRDMKGNGHGVDDQLREAQAPEPGQRPAAQRREPVGAGEAQAVAPQAGDGLGFWPDTERELDCWLDGFECGVRYAKEFERRRARR